MQNDIDNETKKRLIAEEDIKSNQKNFSWGFREWSIETILEKFGENGDINSDSELFIPDYQRDYKWSKKIASRFIESLLLGFPIPYLYIASVEDMYDQEQDGRVEIIDGTQRIRALRYFVNNEYALSDLKELTSLEGFFFKDLLPGRQRKFLRESLRFIELRSDYDGDYRRDLFERINSGIKALVPMEVRKGTEDALSSFFCDVVIPCSNNQLYKDLAPFSTRKKANQDHIELVIRFFAYSDDLENYKGNVAEFLDNYLSKKAQEEHINPVPYISKFTKMLEFVKSNFPHGFKKKASSNSISRTYFEAIAIGVCLALQERPDLIVDADEIKKWLYSNEFTQVVTSDAANNTSKLKARISYVKDKLLNG